MGLKTHAAHPGPPAVPAPPHRSTNPETRPTGRPAVTRYTLNGRLTSTPLLGSKVKAAVVLSTPFRQLGGSGFSY